MLSGSFYPQYQMRNSIKAASRWRNKIQNLAFSAEFTIHSDDHFLNYNKY